MTNNTTTSRYDELLNELASIIADDIVDNGGQEYALEKGVDTLIDMGLSDEIWERVEGKLNPDDKSDFDSEGVQW